MHQQAPLSGFDTLTIVAISDQPRPTANAAHALAARPMSPLMRAGLALLAVFWIFIRAVIATV